MKIQHVWKTTAADIFDRKSIGVYVALAALMAVGITDALTQTTNITEQDPTAQDSGNSNFYDIRLSDIAVIVTSLATVAFVTLLYFQRRDQSREHNLTVRPIITLDKEDNHGLSIRLQKDKLRIRLRLVNLGNIPTGRARTALLPLDDHAGFVRREKKLKEYIKGQKDGDLEEDTKSCIILNPIRERIKSSTRSGSSDKYLLVGDDLKHVKSARSEFESVLDRMGVDKNPFNKAGKDRAHSMVNLNPDDWEKFYQAGSKRGDILDTTGPIDWENFDSDGSITRDEIMTILPDDAVRIYKSEPDRKRILEAMPREDRANFDSAIEKRQEIWNRLPKDVTHDFAIRSMKLRKAYKSVKDIHVRELNLLAPNHPVYLDIMFDESDLKKIESNQYVYFGVLMQYGRPDDKKLTFFYYMQGYLHVDAEHTDDIAHMDYALDFLDV